MIDTRVIRKRIKTSDHEETEEITITNANYLIKSKNKQRHTLYYPILSNTMLYYPILFYTILSIKEILYTKTIAKTLTVSYDNSSFP